MGRAPCCDERLGLKKGPWTPDEDEKLVAYVQEHGHGNWRALPEKAGLARCGKSCRLRWTNYLRPDIKRGRFSHEEEQTIIQLHALMGNRWSAIASHLPRRTDNEIKNYWNTHLKKRLTQMGIDPVTHETSAAGLALSPQWTPLASTRLSHMTQWEIALAEARARLSKTIMDPWNPHHHPHHPSSVPETPHPSSLFMRAWKTKLEENPSSTPIAAPTPIATRPSTRNWQTVLGLPQDDDNTKPTPFSTAMVKVASPDQVLFPDHSDSDPEPLKDDDDDDGEMFTLPATSRCSGFSYCHYDVAAENVYCNSSVPDDVAIENLFSPTSILQGPDSESCSTTSVSGSAHDVSYNSDCLATFLRHSSSGYQTVQSSVGFQSCLSLVDEAQLQDIPETFWQADHHGNGLQLLGGAHPEVAGGGCLELMAPLDFANGDSDPEFLPFDSLCHGTAQ